MATVYETLMAYEIGMEMGLLSVDELRDYLSAQLREKDVPYICTAVYLSLDKGTEAITETIFYNMQGHYVQDRTAGSPVQRVLIGMIRDRYRSGALDLAECVNWLHRLTDYTDGSWELLSIDEYYRLNRSGFCPDEDFRQMLDRIFAQT